MRADRDRDGSSLRRGDNVTMALSLDANAASREQLLETIHRRLLWIGWLASGAGVVVVSAAVVFLIPVFLDADRVDAVGLWNLPFLVVFFAIAGTVLTRTSTRSQERALGWIAEGREPDEREHRLTLWLPASEVIATAIAWAIAGVLFATLNLNESVAWAAVVLAASWLGGETTCALYYLLVERALRPTTSLALAARLPAKPVAPGIRDRLLIAWSLGTGVPIFGVLTVGVVGVSNDSVDTGYVAAACIFLGATAFAVGLLATVFAARSIADPVTSVRGALSRVADGELDAQVRIEDGSEVGLLQAGFNRMVDGLHERERIRDIFGRQVGHDVALAALRDGARLGGEEREVGALFVDLAGSTSMSLAMPPTEVVRLLNRFFRVVIEVVEEEGGLVSKFEGDAALCIFGAPVETVDPAGEALRAARRLAARLERDMPEIGFGIGVSAGRAVAGNVGSEARFEYTVIGDPVNEASRLCDLAKQRSEAVVASEAALGRAAGSETDAWEVTERTVLRGRLEATGVARPAS